MRWIIDAARQITLTMHRVEVESDSLFDAAKASFYARSFKRFLQKRSARKQTALTVDIINYCRKISHKKNVQIKVHTRRDRRFVESALRFANVYDYPITFLSSEERAAAWDQTEREQFVEKYGFKSSDKIVGLFGFLSGYKGVETAIKALSYLPPEYKLGLFGSQHPQSVKRNEPVDPYLEVLFELMGEIDSTQYISKVIQGVAEEDLAPADAINQILRKFVETSSQVDLTTPVTDRVRFIGSLPDPEFIEALRLCDAVILPYLETGQGMSGVIVLSIEAGSKMICANNHSFRETARYFPDTFAKFDIGNHFELASKIEWVCANQEQAAYQAARETAHQCYNIDSSVRLQLSKFGHRFS